MKTIYSLLNNKWFYVTVIIILLYLLFSGVGRSTEKVYATITKTDTIYVNKPYKQIVVKEVVKPQKLYIYKTDTIFREKIIHDTLFVGLSLTKKKAQIHTLTPDGVPNLNEYSLLAYDKLSIDYEGKLQITPPKHPNRKRNLKLLKNVGIFVGGVFIGNQLAK